MFRVRAQSISFPSSNKFFASSLLAVAPPFSRPAGDEAAFSSAAGDVNASLTASRAHALAIWRNAKRAALSLLSTAHRLQSPDSLQQSSVDDVITPKRVVPRRATIATNRAPDQQASGLKVPLMELDHGTWRPSFLDAYGNESDSPPRQFDDFRQLAEWHYRQTSLGARHRTPFQGPATWWVIASGSNARPARKGRVGIAKTPAHGEQQRLERRRHGGLNA
jgi:hypothetical protein